MMTISTRVDEQLKVDAEKVAESIGLSLSAAINVFLRRFVMEEGFPFQVTARMAKPSNDIREMTTSEISAIVQEALRSTPGVPQLPPTVCWDPESEKMRTL